MARIVLFLLTFVLIVAAAGCGASESPEGGAKAFMEAVAQMDGSKMLERTCRAQHDNASAGGAMVQGLLSLASMFTGGMGGEQLAMDMSDLRYSTINQSGNNANVRISGVVRSNIGLAASEQQYDQTVPMLFEDGRWKVCAAVF